MTGILAPAQWVQSVSELSLPARVNRRLQELRTGRAGPLSESEQAELEALAELDRTLSGIRAQAKKLLNSSRPAPDNVGRTIRNGLSVMVVPPGTSGINVQQV